MNDTLKKQSAALQTAAIDIPAHGGNQSSARDKESADHLAYPLTARTLFRLASRIPDQARWMLGYFYEARLKQECSLLLPYPIYKCHPEAIRWALCFRRNNLAFFLCQAADTVLEAYLREGFEHES